MNFAQAVASLGETIESVTTVLREKGIKGYRMSAGSCPVANYLKSFGFGVVTVTTSAKVYDASGQITEESITLPKGVQQWVMNFDDRQYPEFAQ